MEAKLKPEVLELLRPHDRQDPTKEAAQSCRNSVWRSEEPRFRPSSVFARRSCYHKLSMSSSVHGAVRLNNGRIEASAGRLYGLNRRLDEALKARLLRMGVDAGVARDGFPRKNTLTTESGPRRLGSAVSGAF